MLTTFRCRRGIASAPHHLAGESALGVLQEGGTAIEAMVAAAATIAVVYPHMNSIGGDGFWLIQAPGAEPIGIDACGPAAAAATAQRYRSAGFAAVPARGPWAANTVAGTVHGWRLALECSAARQAPLPLERLLRDAVDHARTGVAWTASGRALLATRRAELAAQPGFAATFLDAGAALPQQPALRQPRLAQTLETLAREGLESFYTGSVAESIAGDMRACGALLTGADLAAYRARWVTPLRVHTTAGTLYNLPPPTQGIASLLILALYDRMRAAEAESFAHLHGLIECTKRAFEYRDAQIGDPQFMRSDPQRLLDAGATLDEWAAGIDRDRAAPWPRPAQPGDTVWMGCIDGAGCAVSFIQSTYFEFGSGVVLPSTGITWQNRGCSFRIAPDGWNALRPGRKPFHTLNPAMARLRDGRWLAYGTMGGEGQPQTQAALFTRHAVYGQDLQQSVSAPRWLLGRTWGESSSNLKLEARFPQELIAQLAAAGHEVQLVDPYSSMMGHAGAVVRCADGVLEGATDPRSDGAVRGF